MGISEQLFLLIQAMKKNEKRHFKLYTNKYNKSKEKDIVVLFDIINALKEYDEQLIVTKAQKKGIKNIPYVKNQLKKELLRALTDFNFNYADTVYPSDALAKCDIGLSYKIPELVFEWANKVKVASPPTENAFVKYHLSLKEMSALLWDINKNQAQIEDLFADMRSYVEYVKYDIEYNYLSIRFLYWHTYLPRPVTEEAIKAIEPYVQSKWYQDESLALSFFNKRSLYFCKHLYLEVKGDYEESLAYIQRIVDLYDAHKYVIKQKTECFIIDFSNLLFTYFDLNQLEKVPQLLEKFDSFGKECIAKTDGGYINYQFHYVLVYAYYYHLTEQTNKMIQLIPLAEKYFLTNQYKSLEHNLVFVYFFIINSFFIEKNQYQLSLWLKRYYQQDFRTNHPRIQLVIRFIEIAFQIENGHFKLAKSFLERIKYFKNKMKLTLPIIPIYSSIFRHLMRDKIVNGSEKKLELINSLKENTQQMSGTNQRYYRDVERWLINNLEQDK